MYSYSECSVVCALSVVPGRYTAVDVNLHWV